MKAVVALTLTIYLAVVLSARHTVTRPCIEADGKYCLNVEADGCSDFYITLQKDSQPVGKEKHVRLNTGQQPDQCVTLSDTCNGCTNLAVFEEQGGLALCMRTNVDCGLLKFNYENCTTLPDCAHLDCSTTACQGHGTCDTTVTPPRCHCQPKDGVKYSGLTCGIGTYTDKDGVSCVITPFTEEKPLCSLLEVESCKSVRAEITYGEYRFGPLNFDIDALENHPDTVKPQCVDISFMDQCSVCLTPTHVTLEKGKFRYCSTMHFNCYGFKVPDVDMGCVERDLKQDCQSINNCPDGCIHGKCIDDVCHCDPGYFESDCSYFKNATCLMIPEFEGNALCIKAEKDCKAKEMATTVFYGGKKLKETTVTLHEPILKNLPPVEVATDCLAYRVVDRVNNDVCFSVRVICPDASIENTVCQKSCADAMVHIIWAVLIIIPLALVIAGGVLVYRRCKKSSPRDIGFSQLADDESGSDYGDDGDGL